MPLLSDKQINEIAQELDCGFNCYWHKESGELLFLPNYDHHEMIEEELWEKELEAVEENPDDYYFLEAPKSHESFKIMEGFADSLEPDNPLKEKLFSALNRKGPFKNFRWEVDNSGPFRQAWFEFKKQWLENHVREWLKMLNSPDGIVEL